MRRQLVIAQKIMKACFAGSGSLVVEECPRAPTTTSSTTTTVTSELTRQSTSSATSKNSTSLITTTTSGEESKPTARPPLVPIVAGVLGSATLIAVGVTLFLLRHRLRSCLTKRSTNRVGFTAGQTSTSDGSVKMN